MKLTPKKKPRTKKAIPRQGTDLSATGKDVRPSERMQSAEAALRVSEAHLQLALDASNAGTWSWDVAGNRSNWDERYHRLYEFRPREKPSFELWLNRVHPQDREALLARIQALAKPGGGDAWNEEFRVLLPGKGERWMAGMGRVERDEHGQARRFIGINLDITARKRIEEALRKSEARFRALADFSPDIISIYDREGRLTFNSAAAAKIHGYGPRELDGRSTFDLIHPDDRAHVELAFGRLLKKENEVAAIRYRYRNADGSYTWMEASGRNELANPNIQGIIAISRDISDWVAAEQALQASEEQFRLFMDNSPAVAWMKDERGRFVYLNRTFERRFDARLADWHGKTDKDFSPPELAKVYHEHDLAVLITGRPVEFVEKSVNPDGSLGHWLSVRFLVRNAAGHRFVGGIGLDITERKRAEQLSECFKQLGLQLSAAGSEKEAARIIANAAATLLGWDAIYLTLCTPDTPGVRELINMDTVNGQRCEVPWPAEIRQATPIMRRVLKEGAQLTLRQEGEKPHAHFVPFGDVTRRSRSLMHVPVRIGGRSIGVLSVQSYQSNAYAPRDLEALQALADHAAGALTRLQTQTALAESENRFRTLFEHSGSVMLLMKAEGGEIVAANRAAAHFYGYPLARLVGMSIKQINPRPAEEVDRELAKSGRAARTLTHFQHRLANGDLRDVEIHSAPVELAGQPLLYGIIHDVTERKQAAAALHQLNATLEQRVAERTASLRESEEKFRLLFATVTDAIVVFDAGTKRFVEVNQAALQMYGYTLPEMLHLTAMDLTAEPAASAKSIKQATTSAPLRVSLRFHKKKDGMVFPVEISANTFALQGRTVYCGVVRDITEREKAARLMQQLNRTLRAIRDCHETMLRATSEQGLLEDICRIIVESGGERMAWVGVAEQNAKKTVRPVAAAGDLKNYLKQARITWANEPRGDGPVGRAIRTGQVCLCPNTQTDPSFATWRAAARRLGFGSVISLPLLADKECFGALSIYAPAPDAFDAAERQLLQDLAGDLAFGISTLRLRAESARLENAILKSTEREQERIGRDLHDGLCQLLVGAKFRSSYLKKIADGQLPVMVREAKALEKQLNQAIEQTRDLARGLNPVQISPTGLVAALQKLADDVTSAQGPRCLCRFPARVNISDHQVANHLYRIAQEAVQNALKHARAKNISIAFTRQADRIELAVKDDGVGLTRRLTKTGMGLKNMLTRAKLIGGRLEIRRRRHGGTAVTCELFQSSKAKP
jgi:PAS domain S-box-containing protein